MARATGPEVRRLRIRRLPLCESRARTGAGGAAATPVGATEAAARAEPARAAMQRILRELAIGRVRPIEKACPYYGRVACDRKAADPDKRVYFRYGNGMGISLTAAHCPLPCFALT